MRNLLFALILANLAFAAWHSWFAPREPVIAARGSGKASIVLIDELPPGERRTTGGATARWSSSSAPSARRTGAASGAEGWRKCIRTSETGH